MQRSRNNEYWAFVSGMRDKRNTTGETVFSALPPRRSNRHDYLAMASGSSTSRNPVEPSTLPNNRGESADSGENHYEQFLDPVNLSLSTVPEVYLVSYSLFHS